MNFVVRGNGFGVKEKNLHSFLPKVTKFLNLKRSMALFLAVAFAGFFLILFWANTYYDARVKAAEEHEIMAVKAELDALLQRYRDAIRTVESLDIIDKVAARKISPETQASMDTLRIFLEADSLFVMDANGTQIAGSGAVSVGQNYKYRPYFQKAISGNTYVYPGIGRNLKTPRLFFSSPHFSDTVKTPVGIVGLSVSAKKMADLLKPVKSNMMLGLITEDGVVFAASEPDLLYKTVLPIEAGRLKYIQDSLQFGDLAITPAGISVDTPSVEWNRAKYLVRREKLQNTNIEFFSLHPADERTYFAFMGGVGFVYLLIVFLGFRLATSLKQIKAQQQKLLHQATHDPLTDLLNRRAALELLEKEVVRCKRHSEGLALGMCDIDHFKRINDTWGHQTGDEVLQKISQLLLASVREYDTVARVGGEEFLLIVPLRTGIDSEAIFERICRRINENPIITGSGELAVTISIGVAFAVEESGAANLLAQADVALYQAKALGRNRVEYAT